MKDDVSYLGRIIQIDSTKVEVEINNKYISSTKIINGKTYKIGQVGTLVKFVSGNVITYGIVNSISNISSKEESILTGEKYLIISLIGEKIGFNNFEKGISVYPTVNDECFLALEDDMYDIYDNNIKNNIILGYQVTSDDMPIYIDTSKLVLRHTAIVGSTGSGKSNCVVKVVKELHNVYSGSRVLFVDPHGEYSSAFPNAKIFKIGDKKNPLNVPFWLMNYDELAYFLVGAKSSDDQRPEYRELREKITFLKKENAKKLKADVEDAFITADSPIPFDVRKLWYDMYTEVYATYSDISKQDETTVRLTNKGNYSKLIPPEFEPYSQGNTAPYKSKRQNMYSYEKKLFSRLKDSRYDYLFYPGKYIDYENIDLNELLNEWIGNEERITILDLSNVPFEVLDVTVGLISRFIYDSMFWGKDEEYTSRNRPLCLIYEEAHSYLNDESSFYSKVAVERIFKEGRKFGLGSIVVSQRPSELSKTILSQVGTFISLRLTNSTDQGIIKNMSPDNMSELVNMLPSLRIGEAIVMGEAIILPTRVRIPLIEPRPDSRDPELIKQWGKTHIKEEDNYKQVVKKIRERRDINE